MAPDTPGSAAAAPPAPITALMLRDDGVLAVGGLAIGRVRGKEITLNLGWCSLAGVHVKVANDPEVDRNRSGLVLDRPPTVTR